MARKSLGFVPLIWECPFCNTQNPGPIKSCTGCGAPQPDDVEFLQVDEEKFNFIKDEALIRMVKAGPDIHCPYCGTRNHATDGHCSKCGGDLSLEGKVRQTGERVRTVTEAQKARTAPPEPEKEKKALSKKSLMIGVIALIVILGCIIVGVMLLLKTDTIDATVTRVEWERRIAIEAYTSVTDQDWRDEIPQGAELQSCSQKYRYTSDGPQPNATEVCGEPYIEDTGTGVGEVVQDCTYEVYDDYCEYTYLGWVAIETLTENGADLDPVWPTVTLSSDQREGERAEEYSIVFSGNGKTYTYTTEDVNLYLQADPGSQWTIEVNTLGGVTSAKPSN